MEPTRGHFDMSDVDSIDELADKIEEIDNADSAAERAKLLSDLFLHGHKGSTGYITFGNHKIAKNVGIFNLNSATDCPNADSGEDDESDVGMCQVPWESCYAHVSENVYNAPLDKRRRQQFLWDHIDAKTFADGLLHLKERKTSTFDTLRLSESGDFRHNGDIYKAEEIARLVSGEIDTYTYSASSKLTGWGMVEHMTVNQSNSMSEYGDRIYGAVPEEQDIPEDGILCPYEKSDGEIKCGDCKACVTKDMGNIYITLH